MIQRRDAATPASREPRAASPFWCRSGWRALRRRRDSDRRNRVLSRGRKGGDGARDERDLVNHEPPRMDEHDGEVERTEVLLVLEVRVTSYEYVVIPRQRCE